MHGLSSLCEYHCLGIAINPMACRVPLLPPVPLSSPFWSFGSFILIPGKTNVSYRNAALCGLMVRARFEKPAFSCFIWSPKKPSEWIGRVGVGRRTCCSCYSLLGSSPGFSLGHQHRTSLGFGSFLQAAVDFSFWAEGSAYPLAGERTQSGPQSGIFGVRPFKRSATLHRWPELSLSTVAP